MASPKTAPHSAAVEGRAGVSNTNVPITEKIAAKARDQIPRSRGLSSRVNLSVDNIWQVYMKAPPRHKRSPEWNARDS